MRVEFNETLFDRSTVRVMFLSTCTSSVTVNYSNPLFITIPDTIVNDKICQYTIQLVTRINNTLTVGYAISGIFSSIGKLNFNVKQPIASHHNSLGSDGG